MWGIVDSLIASPTYHAKAQSQKTSCSPYTLCSYKYISYVLTFIYTALYVATTLFAIVTLYVEYLGIIVCVCLFSYVLLYFATAGTLKDVSHL